MNSTNKINSTNSIYTSGKVPLRNGAYQVNCGVDLSGEKIQNKQILKSNEIDMSVINAIKDSITRLKNETQLNDSNVIGAMSESLPGHTQYHSQVNGSNDMSSTKDYHKMIEGLFYNQFSELTKKSILAKKPIHSIDSFDVQFSDRWIEQNC